MNNSFGFTSWARIANICEVNLRQYSEEGTINAFCTAPALPPGNGCTHHLDAGSPHRSSQPADSLGSFYVPTAHGHQPGIRYLADFHPRGKAHKLEINVMLDWVANHTGWDRMDKITSWFFTKDEAKASSNLLSPTGKM